MAVADDAIPLPGREGRNADLPYMLNAFTTTEGVDVVNANCLHCHASRFNGGWSSVSETRASISRATSDTAGIPISDEILTTFGLNEAEIGQFRR